MAEENKDEKKVVNKRKANQITTTVTNTGQIVLFALCDDGTIWQIRPLSDESSWSQVKKVPA